MVRCGGVRGFGGIIFVIFIVINAIISIVGEDLVAGLRSVIVEPVVGVNGGLWAEEGQWALERQG